MGPSTITVCSNCTARTRDASDDRCRHCLEPLSVRRFATEEELEAYRRDRAAHGVDIPQEERSTRRLGLASLFALGSMILVLGGVAVGLTSYFAGGLTELMASLGDASWMLGIGVAMFVAARSLGGAR